MALSPRVCPGRALMPLQLGTGTPGVGGTLCSEPLTGLTSLDWQPVAVQVLGQVAQGQVSESGH